MDSDTNTPVRKWLMQHCNLISAIRLPHNLFTDYAGTAVGSDLLVLQKDSSKTALHNSLEEEFMQTLGNERHITMNKLFARHDNLILHTSAKQDKDPYGKPAMIYTFDGTTEDMAGAINGILSRDMERRFDRDLYLKNMSERKRHVSLTATARQFAVIEKQADDTAAEYSFAVTSETAANETERSFPQGTETVSNSTDNDSPQSGNADIPTTSAMLAGGLFSSYRETCSADLPQSTLRHPPCSIMKKNLSKTGKNTNVWNKCSNVKRSRVHTQAKYGRSTGTARSSHKAVVTDICVISKSRRLRSNPSE